MRMEMGRGGRGLTGLTVVCEPATKRRSHWWTFRSWENRGRGGVFVADAAKIVAVVKFFVAETGLIGRTVVSETATKVWPHLEIFRIWGMRRNRGA